MSEERLPEKVKESDLATYMALLGIILVAIGISAGSCFLKYGAYFKIFFD